MAEYAEITIQLTKKLPVVDAEHSDKFIKKFNSNGPSKEFMESCRKAGELFRRIHP